MLTKIRFRPLAAAALIASLSATLSSPAAADERLYQPIEGISAEIGSKHFVGFFVNEDGRCQITVMVEESWDPETGTPSFTAARMRFDLGPTDTASLDSAEKASLSLTCGEGADSLVLGRPEQAYAYSAR